jgi:N utilization substance protein B
VRGISPEEAVRNYYGGLYSEEADEKPGRDKFMEDLVDGTFERRPEIDAYIQQHSEHWRVERMPAVDRNILRLAVYELLNGKLPPPVVIDEALELARRFSGQESVAFMNGVLDAVRKNLPAGNAPPE